MYSIYMLFYQWNIALVLPNCLRLNHREVGHAVMFYSLLCCDNDCRIQKSMWSWKEEKWKWPWKGPLPRPLVGFQSALIISWRGRWLQGGHIFNTEQTPESVCLLTNVLACFDNLRARTTLRNCAVCMILKESLNGWIHSTSKHLPLVDKALWTSVTHRTTPRELTTSFSPACTWPLV